MPKSRRGDHRYRVRERDDNRSIGSGGTQSDDSDSEGHIPRDTKTIADRFEVRGQLGKGTFGRVFDAFDTKQGRDVAIKCVRKVTRYREDALVEAGICWELQKDREGRDL